MLSSSCLSNDILGLIKNTLTNPNVFVSALHIWGGHYRGARWAIDSLLICGRTDGQAGGGEREAHSLGVFVLVVVLRKMTTKNSSVLFFVSFFFFCKTENNRHVVKLPIAKKRQTWAAAHSPSSLVRHTMRDVATMWYYWVSHCLYKMWSQKRGKNPFGTLRTVTNKSTFVGLRQKN